MIRTSLYPVLRGALHARDVATLRRLYQQHGAAAFAGALSVCSSRVSADALSLLPLQGRIRVFPHLPASARAQVRPLCRSVHTAPALAPRSGGERP